MIDPTGRPWLLDGHHSALITLRLVQLAGLASYSVSVIVEKDFTSQSWPEFYQHLEKEKMIYLPPEIRNSKMPLQQKLKFLANDLFDLNKKDDFMRSLLGTAFKEIDISGKDLVRYIEFYLAEIIIKDVSLQSLQALDFKDAVKYMVKKITEPSALQFLAAHADSDEARGRVQIMLAASLIKSKRLDLRLTAEALRVLDARVINSCHRLF